MLSSNFSINFSHLYTILTNFVFLLPFRDFWGKTLFSFVFPQSTLHAVGNHYLLLLIDFPEDTKTVRLLSLAYLSK